MHTTKKIHCERLYLRCLREEDIGVHYLGWMRDNEILQFLEARFQTHTQESLCQFVMAANNSANELLLGIFMSTTNQHIGNIKIGPVHPVHQHAAIGIMIGERGHWGKGYAGEAICGATQHAFQLQGIQKLYAGCYASNEGSRRAFLRAGYIEEGRFAGHWIGSDGKRVDGIQLGCLKSNWNPAVLQAR